jgi:hypothetical protein
MEIPYLNQHENSLQVPAIPKQATRSTIGLNAGNLQALFKDVPLVVRSCLRRDLNASMAIRTLGLRGIACGEPTSGFGLSPK